MDNIKNNGIDWFNIVYSVILFITFYIIIETLQKIKI